jgi:hypothetical protein
MFLVLYKNEASRRGYGYDAMRDLCRKINVDMFSGFNVGVKIYNHLCSILQNVQIEVRDKMDSKETTQGE